MLISTLRKPLPPASTARARAAFADRDFTMGTNLPSVHTLSINLIWHEKFPPALPRPLLISGIIFVSLQNAPAVIARQGTGYECRIGGYRTFDRRRASL